MSPRILKKTTRMASPTAASAAATVSTSMANICPVIVPEKTENAIRLRFTDRRISSIAIRMTMMFFRFTKIPTTPTVNRNAETVR